MRKVQPIEQTRGFIAQVDVRPVPDELFNWLPIQAVADMLGVSKTTVYNHIRSGELPAARLPFGGIVVHLLSLKQFEREQTRKLAEKVQKQLEQSRKGK